MGRHVNTLVGRRFGSLTVVQLAYQPAGMGKNTRWDCICDCGTNKPAVARSNLLAGNVVRCSPNCRLKAKPKPTMRTAVSAEGSQADRHALEGKRFGKLVVQPGGLIRLSCLTGPKLMTKCDCGNRHMVLPAALNQGNTTSCGCAGTGQKKRAKDEVAQYDQWVKARPMFTEKQRADMELAEEGALLTAACLQLHQAWTDRDTQLFLSLTRKTL